MIPEGPAPDAVPRTAAGAAPGSDPRSRGCRTSVTSAATRPATAGASAPGCCTGPWISAGSRGPTPKRSPRSASGPCTTCGRPAERREQPDRLPAGSAYVVADVLGDAPGISPAEFAEAVRGPGGRGPRARRRPVGDVLRGRVPRLRPPRERPGGIRPPLRPTWRIVRAMPALFHCTAGKDRTGWAAAALQLFLGVPDDLVLGGVSRSAARGCGPWSSPFIDGFAARGGEPELLRPLLGVSSRVPRGGPRRGPSAVRLDRGVRRRGPRARRPDPGGAPGPARGARLSVKTRPWRSRSRCRGGGRWRRAGSP